MIETPERKKQKSRAYASLETRRLQGRAAIARRWGNADAAELERDTAAARLADFARHLVADLELPLTEDQVETIVAVLRSGGRDAT